MTRATYRCILCIPLAVLVTATLSCAAKDEPPAADATTAGTPQTGGEERARPSQPPAGPAPVSPVEASGLHFAIQAGDHERIEYLLAQGVDIEGTFSEERFTPLHVAAFTGQTKIVELLIGKGAKVNAVDRSGSTPLHLAVHSGQLAAVRQLLGHGAEVDAKTHEGLTPLQLAKIQGHQEIAQVLEGAGAR